MTSAGFEPPTCGEVLRKFLDTQASLTQERLADAMGVSRLSVNQIINERRAVTADMALRLGRVLRTTPEFWLTVQQGHDLWAARLRIGNAVNRLKVLRQGETVT